MKIFAVFLLHRVQPDKCQLLLSETDLSSFGYFQRSSVLEFMTFFAKTIAERSPTPGQRQSVEKQDYMVHVHTKQANLSGIVVCDREYPQRVAFALLQRIFDEFLSAFPDQKRWLAMVERQEQASSVFPFMRQSMDKYQNPNEADNLMKIQKELDETTVIMHKTIEDVLRRGEQLDDLASKSDELSAASKMFYQTAKSNNSCCQIM